MIYKHWTTDCDSKPMSNSDVPENGKDACFFPLMQWLLLVNQQSEWGASPFSLPLQKNPKNKTTVNGTQWIIEK